MGQFESACWSETDPLPIERLPEHTLPEAERLLSSLTGPFLQSLLNAPEDDEPLTDQDIEAIEQARADRDAGRLIPWEVVRRELLENG